MKRVAVAAAVLFIAWRAGALCLGDFNGDGKVAINEIITSVNNALNSCQGSGPTPTPLTGPRCPIDFSDDNSQPGTTDCTYTGRWNQACGAADLQARWISDGTFVVVFFLGFPGDGLFYGAEVTSPTSADLIGWYTKADASDLTCAPGDLTLAAAGGALVLAPTTVPFQIESCDFSRFQAALTQVTAASAGSAATLRAVAPAAFEQLRAARAAHAAKPDLRRQ